MPSHKLRIVYMGTPDFAVLPLNYRGWIPGCRSRY